MANPRTIELLASAARTATPTAGRDYDASGANGIRVVVDVTALSATPSVVMTVEGKDPVSGKYYTLLAGTAITNVTGTGTYVYEVWPGATVTGGVSANKPLSGTWRVTLVHGDADSITYSAAAELLYV